MHLQNVLLRCIKMLRKEQSNVFFYISKVKFTFMKCFKGFVAYNININLYIYILLNIKKIDGISKFKILLHNSIYKYLIIEISVAVQQI